ncbi:MAG: hypothetical protein EA399_00210, partial [Desulfovibrionales bacterium]
GMLDEAEHYWQGLVEAVGRPEHYRRLAGVLGLPGKEDQAFKSVARGETSSSSGGLKRAEIDTRFARRHGR